MPGSYEKNIRWKAIGIYMLIAVICIAASLYIYSLSGSVRSQKQHIENYSDLLKITNQVVFSVSEAQSTANIYLNSKNAAHLRAFRGKVEETETLLDSLAYLSRLTGDTSNLGHIMEIGALLRQKGDIVYRLNTQLTSYNPVDSIQKLFTYDEPVIIQDTVLVTSVVPESFEAPRRTNFWERVSGAFVPERDTVLTVRTDTLRTLQPDSVRLVPDAMNYVEQIRTGYSSNIRALERQINSLMMTDQEISAQIIEVLNRFHTATIRSTIRHIEDSEDVIQQNYRYSFAGIMISLLLVTFFVILIINDTNKGQQARIQLERANERVREIMASRHKLLLSVSHDIKTPLNAILGYLELWKQGREPDEGDIAVAELSGKHINALIGNLLEFSSLEQGIALPSAQAFALLPFCEETAGMVRQQAAKKGLEFTTSFRIPRGLYIEADSMRLRQIILNILSNAVKYTTEGGVTFGASFNGDRIKLTVTDTGTGMDSEELERICKPFRRMERNSAMAEGHGFGMFVVRGLVDLLGGEMDIRSAPGEGTTVVIMVPAQISDFAVPEASRRILFVDDDTVLLQILTGMASALSHRASSTSDAGGIVSGATDVSGYGMVITDMEMGNYKGTDVLAAVRRRSPGTPVVVMTGHHDFTARSTAELGFDAYIPKPVSLSSLEAVAGRAVNSGTAGTQSPPDGKGTASEKVPAYNNQVAGVACYNNESAAPDTAATVSGSAGGTAVTAGGPPVSAGGTGVTARLSSGKAKADSPESAGFPGKNTTATAGTAGTSAAHAGNSGTTDIASAEHSGGPGTEDPGYIPADGRADGTSDDGPADGRNTSRRNIPASLIELFGDGEELQEIIDTFKTAASDDMRNLRSALFRRDFRTVKSICHRMLPLFRQFGSDECTEVLCRLNAATPQEGAGKGFWKDLAAFIDTGTQFLDELR
ncbi:MAG: response regulator [Rikenellaceae bacterium]|nr:response regulator [Rikenellaceae bacterium]